MEPGPLEAGAPSTAGLDLAALRRRLAERVRLGFRAEGFREAAVLVPILVEEGRPERVILTLRHAGLRAHAGQIAFPGGKRDKADIDSATTAIRETVEELGLAAADIEVLGLLDDVPTPSGYAVTPVVGALRGPVELRPAVDEVAEAFLVELPALRAAHRTGGTREWLGHRWEMHEFLVGERRIWGATARMIWQLLGLLDPARTVGERR